MFKKYVTMVQSGFFQLGKSLRTIHLLQTIVCITYILYYIIVMQKPITESTFRKILPIFAVENINLRLVAIFSMKNVIKKNQNFADF